MTSNVFIRVAALPFLLVLTLACSPAQADSITLTFDVNVLDQFNYATMALNPNFQSFSTTMTVTFDNAVTLIEQDPNNTLVFFGPPLIDSPLTATLPYGPAAGQPPPPSSAVALGNRDYGPSQQWSEFTIVENQETESGATTWVYGFDLDSDGLSLYPLIPNLLQDSRAALYQQLLAYQQNHAALAFEEFAYQFDSQTGQYLGGTGYNSTAYLEEVEETPEPSTLPILGGAAFVFFGLKQRHIRHQRNG